MPMTTLQGIAKVPDTAVDFLLVDLLVRKRRQTTRTPIDDVMASIDEPLFVQAHERLTDGTRGSLIQREVRPGPGRRAAYGLELVENRCSRLSHVGPDAIHKRIPAEIEA